MTEIKAPFPNPKVTILLPNPRFDDARATEATVQIKKTMTGRTISYVKSSDRVRIILPFMLTRMKSLELEAFLKAYQSAHWRLTLYDASEWDVQLIGQPVTRVAVGRAGDYGATGKESIEVTLTLSGKRLN